MSWDWSSAELARLQDFLGSLGVVDAPIRTRRIGDGHSNLTFLVDDGTHRVVVRRPPPPPTPPGAHDVLREARVLSALRDTAVAVPDVLGVVATGVVLDVPLYVMSLVDGPVVTTRTPDALADHRHDLAVSLIDTLAALHAVDWRAVGLHDFGRPEGFNARHVARMSRLVADDNGTPPDGFGEIEAWLRANVPPESGTTIVHNDFRIGNVILAPEPPGRVAAVLDWELATLGDPLVDVAYFLASYPEAGEELTATSELGRAVLEPGYPTRADLAARYTALTGRDLTDLRWFTAVVQWKLAVLYEYSRRQAVDDYYADPAHVQTFLRAAHRAAEPE